jgi:hypothetical protein
MSYDPRTYWTDAPAMKVKPAHEAQAAALMDASRCPPSSRWVSGSAASGSC